MWMLKVLRKLGEFLFDKPTLESIAREELYSAERELMQLKNAREYTLGLIDYREKQISRLKNYLQTLETSK
jgi:hypothetical protein